MTLIGGQLLAVLVLFVLQQFLSQDELRAWGWRIPFFIGAAAAIVALFLRRTLTETTSAEDRAKREAGTLRGLARYPREVATVLGFTAGGSLIFYTFTTYMQKYLVNTAGFETKTATTVMTAVLFVYMILQPAFGALSDRIGRKASMLWFGGLATLATVPLLTAISTVASPTTAFALIITGLAIVSFYTSISGLVKAELFPTEVRALGVGLTYGVGNAIFGGTAEYVALWFKQAGRESWFFWYVAFMCAIAFVVAITMRDSRKHGHLIGDHKLAD